MSNSANYNNNRQQIAEDKMDFRQQWNKNAKLMQTKQKSIIRTSVKYLFYRFGKNSH